MARVTVEDCVDKVPNRFDLVLLAAQRARDISVGAPETVDRDNDKNPVVALREIAEGTVSLDVLQESLVTGLQKHLPFDDFEEEEPPMTAISDVPSEGPEAAVELSAPEEEGTEEKDGETATDEAAGADEDE